MSKILGDNPFDDDEAAAQDAVPDDDAADDGAASASPSDDAPATPAKPPRQRKGPKKGTTAAKEAAAREAAEATTATTDTTPRNGAFHADLYADAAHRPPERIATADIIDTALDEPSDDAGGDWASGAVPDAMLWPDSSGMADDDVFLGEEAVVPPGEYGRVYDRDGDVVDAEFREIERRLDAQRTPVFPLDMRRRIGMGFLGKRWRQLAMMGRSDVVDDFGRDPRATARWEPVLDFLYSKWFRVETEGLENVPGDGAALLVANHAGTLPYDSAMIVHAVRRDHPDRRDVRPLVEDAIFHLPWLGPLINRIGGVRACPENAERLLARGELVAVFPEGVKGMGKLWRDRYRLQRFGRGGFVKLALRTGAPLIPVAIVGAEEAMPMGAKVTWFAKSVGIPWVPVTPTFPWLGPAGLLPLPSKWMIRIGEPIDLGDHGPGAANDRLLVGRLAETVRGRIQEMVDELRGRRRSPFV